MIPFPYLALTITELKQTDYEGQFEFLIMKLVLFELDNLFDAHTERILKKEMLGYRIAFFTNAVITSSI